MPVISVGLLELYTTNHLQLADKMDKIKSKLAKPIKDWRRRNSVDVGEHEGYDNTPLPRLTWKGFWMGMLVSMGGFVFG